MPNPNGRLFLAAMIIGITFSNSALCADVWEDWPDGTCTIWEAGKAGICSQWCYNGREGNCATQPVCGCTACGGGRTLECKEVDIGAGHMVTVCDCSECPSTCPTTSWKSLKKNGDLIAKYMVRCVIDEEKCDEKCMSGYYRASTSSTAECVRCPKLNDAGSFGLNTTVNGLITDCYIPTTYKYTDDAGEWQFSDNCYYSK